MAIETITDPHDPAATCAARCPGCDAALAGNTLLAGPDRFIGGPGVFTVERCGGCGLASTQPRIAPDQFDLYYPESYQAYEPPSEGAGGRGKRGVVDRLRIEAMLRIGPYRPLFKRTPGRLLDVGCGIGDLALAFRRHDWDVAGVEPSDTACTHARARGIDIHCGTLDDAPWSDGTFDAIVFNHSLEHIPDPAGAIERAMALLRPGGMLAVAVPNFGSWHRRLFGARWFQLDLPRHLQHFDAASLEGLLGRAGAQPVARRAATMRPSPLMSLQYALFGRPVLHGRPLRLAGWAIVPLLLLADAVADGDCLHVFAVKPSG
jgi:SAM-dependent methyltransferase